MRKFVYNKLVRDKILDSMLEKGEKVEYKILSKTEYFQELKNKLIEEASEIDLSNNEKIIKELADFQEILDCILNTIGKTKVDVEAERLRKNDKAGSFKKRIFITTTELHDDNEWIVYLESNPDRYPEIK